MNICKTVFVQETVFLRMKIILINFKITIDK